MRVGAGASGLILAAAATGLWAGAGRGGGDPARAVEEAAVRAGAPPALATGMPAASAAVLASPDGPSATTGLQDPPSYDGGFHFLRIQYGAVGLRGFGRRGREAPWEHDRPRAERNFLKILSNTTFVNRGENRDDWLHLPLDHPDLFRYPIAYIVEVGYWRPSGAEATALREYLLKGGFLIVDDFRGGHIYNFEEQMRLVLPGARLFQLTGAHEIFDSFFRIDRPEAMIPAYGREAPIYLGIFEDNDPSKRLMAIANYNNDIAEYWEYSDRGYYAVPLSNEAFKFGVNYVVYGMTH